MHRSIRTSVFYFCISYGGMLGMVHAQVIFKIDSPIKRHLNVNFSSQEAGVPLESPFVDMDSVANQGLEQIHPTSVSKPDSVNSTIKRSDELSTLPVSRKPQFLVTCMGSPLTSDASRRNRYRLAPLEDKTSAPIQRNLSDPLFSFGKRYVDQDSIMVAQLEDSLRHIREQLIPLQKTNQKWAKSAFDLYRSIPSILPVRLRSLTDFRVSSTYGLRVHPISGRLQNHAGIDLPQPRFTAVYATADGVVDRIVWQPNGMGLAIYIVHPSGYQTGYGHLEDHSVLVGEEVRRGQVIGRVGSTGLSTGPHLHYTVLVGTQPVDPASYCFLLLNALEETKSSVSVPAPKGVYK